MFFPHRTNTVNSVALYTTSYDINITLNATSVIFGFFLNRPVFPGKAGKVNKGEPLGIVKAQCFRRWLILRFDCKVTTIFPENDLVLVLDGTVLLTSQIVSSNGSDDNFLELFLQKN